MINSVFIYAEAIFWVVTAYFIYFSGTFFLYLYIPTLTQNDQKTYYDILNSIFTIVRTALLSIAIFIKRPVEKLI